MRAPHNMQDPQKVPYRPIRLLSAPKLIIKVKQLSTHFGTLDEAQLVEQAGFRHNFDARITFKSSLRIRSPLRSHQPPCPRLPIMKRLLIATRWMPSYQSSSVKLWTRPAYRLQLTTIAIHLLRCVDVPTSQAVWSQHKLLVESFGLLLCNWSGYTQLLIKKWNWRKLLRDRPDL